MVARRIALLGRSQTLGLIHLRAQLQALGHARLCAALLEASHTGAVQSFVALVALACSVEAQAVLVALVQLSAGLETAVMARPAGVAVARMCLSVALSATRARVRAFLLLAVCPVEVGCTEACSVEAPAVGLVTSTDASGNGTVGSREAVVTVTDTCPLLANSMVVAVSGAPLGGGRGRARYSKQADRAQTVTAVALAAVG